MPRRFSSAAASQVDKPDSSAKTGAELLGTPEPDLQLIGPVLTASVALGALDAQHIELADQVARSHGNRHGAWRRRLLTVRFPSNPAIGTCRGETTKSQSDPKENCELT